jgi:cytochrome P450
MRRNPFPFYDEFRSASPVLYLEPYDFWLIFDYDGVKRALEDHATFSSEARTPGTTGKPFDWMIFNDPPRHAKLRALINRAFTPRIVADLEPRIRRMSSELLAINLARGEMDLVADYSAQLPMMVIADLLGIPPIERTTFKYWSDSILTLANTVEGGEAAKRATLEYRGALAQMDVYVKDVVNARRRLPQDDLLSKLAHVEVDGVRLTDSEILGFFQLLLLAGSETTINLINNAVLCLVEHPDQFARLRQRIDLLPTAIEEVLRFRSPLQAVFRQTTCEVEAGGQLIPADKLVLPLIGSANRDPRHFLQAQRFDIARNPNPHIAFGHGVHFCLGASLARLEAKIAIGDLMTKMRTIELISDEPWEPRPAFHVHGPLRLPIRITGCRARSIQLRARNLSNGYALSCNRFHFSMKVGRSKTSELTTP